MILTCALCSTLFFASPIFAEGIQEYSGKALVREILSDIVYRVADRAVDVVRENTGVDLNERGYQSGKKYRPMPKQASEETRRELAHLKAEHDREMRKLEVKVNEAYAKFNEEIREENQRVDEKQERIIKKAIEKNEKGEGKWKKRE